MATRKGWLFTVDVSAVRVRASGGTVQQCPGISLFVLALYYLIKSITQIGFVKAELWGKPPRTNVSH
jgi:hypothetical protein